MIARDFGAVIAQPKRSSRKVDLGSRKRQLLKASPALILLIFQNLGLRPKFSKGRCAASAMRNQLATDSQQQTVMIGGLAPSVDLLYQLPCPAHMPHPRWRNHSRREREKVGDLRRADELRLVCVEDAHRRAVIAPLHVTSQVPKSRIISLSDGEGCTPGRR